MEPTGVNQRFPLHVRFPRPSHLSCVLATNRWLQHTLTKLVGLIIPTPELTLRDQKTVILIMRGVGLLDAIKVPQHPPLVRTVAWDFILLQKTRDIGRVQREQ